MYFALGFWTFLKIWIRACLDVGNEITCPFRLVDYGYTLIQRRLWSLYSKNWLRLSDFDVKKIRSEKNIGSVAGQFIVPDPTGSWFTYETGR